jgi:cell division protein FtsB
MNRPGRKLSHAKELYYILCIVAVALGVMFSVWGPGGYLQIRKARAELETRRARINEMQRENADRYDRIVRLQTDPAAMEELARQKGFGREGEIVQPVPESPAAEKADRR